MENGYIFVTNGNKPSLEAYISREDVKLSNFSVPPIEAALDLGFDCYMSLNRQNAEEIKCDYPIHFYEGCVYRNIFNFKEIRKARKNLDEIVKKTNCKCIHCNTPIGGLIGRQIGKKNHVDKVIYTAHGFHFYKGGSLFKNVVFKFIERRLARSTDAIITMNNEDYEAAKKFKLKSGGKVYKVHGVGITLKDFENISIDRKEKRKELGLKEDDIALISAGDLIKRKNYLTAICAIKACNNLHIHYLICGIGPELESLKALAKKLGIENQIHFLGFRQDIKEIMLSCDIFLFTTLQEGLPRSLMEAMASGLPCIASNIRGNIDLIEDGINGILCNPKDSNSFANSIKFLINNGDLLRKMKLSNLEKIKEYDVSVVKEEMKKIYKEVLTKHNSKEVRS
ncbi:MAG: glycosyltransferase [Bacilli bacterium]|nr:glycosyltransferase [Bacilli bacterium]